MARALRSPSMKLTETPAAQRTTHSTSSPITIPKKPPRVALSTPTSSSASLGESSSVPSRVDSDDNLSVLPSTGQQLQHTAARDRISVKNARRQPLKQKLSTLRENDDQNQENNKHTVLSSTPTDDESVAPSTRTTEVKAPQPLIDLSDISSARARLRMSVRTRDRSADNLLLAKTTSNEIETHSTENPLTPKLPSVIQRSVSFKRPQEIQEKTPLPRPLVLRKIDNDEPSSSQEHIYDNLDVFKTETSEVKTRENVGKASIRLRPVTMHVATPNDESSSSSSTPNEFEQIFNQLKKRGSIRRVRVPEETPPVAPPTPPPPPPPIEPEPEPAPVVIKPPTVLPSPQPAPRRKTLGTHKVAIEEPKPTPSWIDIAKQKQTKFQTGSNDGKTTSEENQPESAPKSPVISRKTTPSSETRLNRQSMFEPSALSNTHPIERDSIRALKAGNPNRINNLIQFFDK